MRTRRRCPATSSGSPGGAHPLRKGGRPPRRERGGDWSGGAPAWGAHPPLLRRQSSPMQCRRPPGRRQAAAGAWHRWRGSWLWMPGGGEQPLGGHQRDPGGGGARWGPRSSTPRGSGRPHWQRMKRSVRRRRGELGSKYVDSCPVDAFVENSHQVVLTVQPVNAVGQQHDSRPA